MNVLVIGGTRFFGRRLVHQMIREGHSVTVATRGNTVDDFGDRVTRVRVDRDDAGQMKSAFANRSYDVVFDQVGFHPNHAKSAIEAFEHRVKRYVFCSSMAVYEGKQGVITEADFDASHYPYQLGLESYEYGEGKRQAEAYFAQHAPFPVISVRVAMVVSGDDDYTQRFAFHVRHVAEGQSIGLPAESHPISFVTAHDVAQFLYHVGFHSTHTGGVNAANSGFESARGLCERIGQILGKAPLFHVGEPGADEHFSPYGFPFQLTVSNELAKDDGFEFSNWLLELPEMVRMVLGS